MISKIAQVVYSAIRKQAGLSIDDVALAIGKKRQIVYRIEGGTQLLNAEQETALLERANLSKEAQVEIMCKALTAYLGRPVMIAPKSRFRPSSPLMRADDLYLRHIHKLEPAMRDRIDAILQTGRQVDAAADRAASQFEMEVRWLLREAIGPDALSNV